MRIKDPARSLPALVVAMTGCLDGARVRQHDTMVAAIAHAPWSWPNTSCAMSSSRSSACAPSWIVGSPRSIDSKAGSLEVHGDRFE